MSVPNEASLQDSISKLPKLDSEDIRKLHAEINQLVNQRFTINTTAIAFFGVGNGWLLQKGAAGSVWFSWLGFLVILLILSCLHLYSIYLGKILRTFSTYLVARNVGLWETEWEAFREKWRYFSYTRASRYLFAVLGGLSFGLALMISELSNLTVPVTSIAFGTVVLAAYLALNFLGERAMGGASEKDLVDQWRATLVHLHQRSADSPDIQ